MTNDHFVNLMPLSNSVLRRYTPPTCTLEIVAKSSPLSHWVKQSLMKDLRFELRFDDPRQPEEKRVTIRGNATDLEMLCDAVNSYVQNILDPSSLQLPLVLQTSPTNGASPSNSVAIPAVEKAPDESNNASSFGNPDSNPKIRAIKPSIPTEIYLQPRGLLYHDLFLGQLATEEFGSVVALSVIQLFDLASALDEYAAEIVALPKLSNPLKLKKASPAWTAAAGVLVAVGVTAAGVQYFNQPNKQQTASSSKAGQPTPLTAQVPPSVPIAPVRISPLPTPVLPPALATSPKLTPPTPVGIPVLPPTAASPPVNQRPALSVNPSPPTTIALSPNSPKLIAPAPGIVSRGTSPLPAASVPGKNTGSAASGSGATRSTVPTFSTTPPPLNLPSLSPNKPSGTVTAQTAPAAGSSRSITRPTVDLNQSEPATTTNSATNNTLLAEKAQVTAVKNYLQQGWKPPSGLTENLGYTLWLNADGSLQRVEPQTPTAEKYMKNTGIPLPGQPFVSPLEGGRNPIIRVNFTPDGKVETPDYPR